MQISPTACNFSNIEVSQEGDEIVCEFLSDIEKFIMNTTEKIF
jgi:hypothetical protein